MKIVVTEPLHMADGVRSALERLGTVAYGPFNSAALARELPDCNVLVLRLGHYLDGHLLGLAPQLHFVVTATTGLDHIDLSAAQARGIRVISLRDCPDAIRDVSATAEHSWALLLALLRRIPPAAAHVREGGWNRDLFFGAQLRGKQLGILGHGRIGSMVARYGHAFGMKVVAHDVDPERIVPPAIPAALEEVVRTSDILSLHVTASAENRHFVGRRLIASMKPGAVIVNTARGAILDEAAVAEAVAAGRLAGVAVDVIEGEETSRVDASPLLASLRAGHNVLVTPHIGGATFESIAQAEAAVVQILSAAMDGARS
jgi:D-3-phosphoglycerate dehydrogenase